MSPFVIIRVTGPKTLVPNTLMRGQECDINWTWLEFLNVRCQLRINASDQVIVRTASHRSGTAWEANLGDCVMDFINKYSRIRTSYTIRLTMITARTHRSPAICPRAVSARRTGRLQHGAPGSNTSSSIVNTVKNNRKISKKDCGQNCSGCRTVPPRGKKTKIPSSRFESGVELQPIDNSGVASVFEDDNSSSDTTVAAGRQPERSGMKNIFIKPDIIHQLMTLENQELVRIQDELQTLVDKRAWCRLIYRVPRTGHFLSNIFRLRMFPAIEDLF